MPELFTSNTMLDFRRGECRNCLFAEPLEHPTDHAGFPSSDAPSSGETVFCRFIRQVRCSSHRFWRNTKLW